MSLYLQLSNFLGTDSDILHKVFIVSGEYLEGRKRQNAREEAFSCVISFQIQLNLLNKVRFCKSEALLWEHSISSLETSLILLISSALMAQEEE